MGMDGGMMGAMLGQMIRPFNIELFIPFFTFVFLITMIGITYAVNCRVSCCNTEQNKEKNKLSKGFILLWLVTIIFLLTISVILPFSIDADKKTPLKASDSLSEKNNQSLQLPPYLQELMKEDKKEAVIKGDYQEAASILQKSPRGSSALLRLAIQKLCIELGEDGENINNDIKSLVSKGLPTAVQKSLDIVRAIGNEAVHPGQIDLKDDIETAPGAGDCRRNFVPAGFCGLLRVFSRQAAAGHGKGVPGINGEKN